MARKKKTVRVYNPKTRKYYIAEVQKNGQYRFIGEWSPKKRKASKKKSKK